MNAVNQFAVVATAFQRWAVAGSDSSEVAVRQAIKHLAELVAAALALPPLELGRGDPPRVTDDEWRRVFEACQRLPIRHYSEVFDPLPLTPGEAGIGDLADDLADIYRDVVSGLRAYENGDPAEAVWQWQFHFWCHWGRHATSAMRVLYAWLAANRSAS